MENARRVYVRVEYDGKDITDELSKMALTVTYTDNTDKGDDLTVEFEDRAGNWAGDWFPKAAAKGDS